MSDPETRAAGLETNAVRAIVAEAPIGDEDRGIVRLGAAAMARLEARTGSVVAIRPCGEGQAGAVYARLMPATPACDAADQVTLDPLQRLNTGLSVGEQAVIEKTSASIASSLTLASLNHGKHYLLPEDRQRLSRHLENMPVAEGMRLRVSLVGGHWMTLVVKTVEPKGPSLIGPGTDIQIEEPPESAQGRESGVPTYADIGGLGRQLSRIREMIELPLRHADAFRHLGIEPPRGVLLTGPPGTGKTLIARAVAHEVNACFELVNGPEIVDKLYGASEAQLREVFIRAREKAPAIIFIDELDAIAPKREELGGDRQVERRVVAQLLTLMDGLEARGDVVVIGATNIANSLDPALRRPGRFDREIEIGVPDKRGRAEILDIHMRHMPVAPEVDIDALAAATHGYVGADLAAFVREAGMSALRRSLLSSGDMNGATAQERAGTSVETIRVSTEDFHAALQETRPSAVREVFTETPDVSWSEIGGLDKQKAILRETVEWPVRYEKVLAASGLRPAKGVLLHGPPGTGKTMLAKALASETGWNFISIKGPQLVSRYLGESERAIRDIFQKARSVAPCIVFFDEIDAVVPKRSGEHQAAERIVAQILSEMDGVNDLRGVLVVGATNRLDRIDDAMLRPGRFDILIEMPYPDEPSRVSILKIHTHALRLDPGLVLDKWVKCTDGFSGAELEELVRRAALNAFRKEVERGGTSISSFVVRDDDFATAFGEISHQSPGTG